MIILLAKTYIEKLIQSGQRALSNLDDEEQLTVVDIQKVFGDLDYVKHYLEAAQCLLREEFKELRDK